MSLTFKIKARASDACRLIYSNIYCSGKGLCRKGRRTRRIRWTLDGGCLVHGTHENIEGRMKSMNRVKERERWDGTRNRWIMDIHSPVLSTCPLHTNSGLWEREAHINWSMVTCQGSTRSELP